jgi:hypothetical protein
MEVGSDELRKLLINVLEHVEILCVFLAGGVNIVSSAVSELPVILHSLDLGVSGRSVWENASNLVLLGINSEVALDGKVLMVGSQSTQEVKSGVGFAALFLDGLIREIDLEGHLAVVGSTPVLNSL